ncbi:MAG: NAD(P)H-dependent glycerol-3-phosphate dehydrogenase [Calditrichia bacterium]
MSIKRVGVIGAGSWGTTLANLLAENGADVLLYVYEKDQLEIMRNTRINDKYLPGVTLHPRLNFTDELPEAVADKDMILLAVPTHVMRPVVGSIPENDWQGKLIVNVSKGIENDTLMRMSEVIADVTGAAAEQIVSLYGPSHAEEVSRKVATAVVAASTSLKSARLVRDIFRNEYFRVYSSTDIVGVELGGSLKNVIAIAAGIADGAGFGDNTKAALITRALVEMTRLGVTMGAEPETFAGLSGMGDLIVTCMSRHSRNRHVGEEIGRGKPLQQVLDEMVMVAEGVKTTRSVHQLIGKYQVEMPISEQVYQVLFHNKNPHNAVRDLMLRDPKEEARL